MIILTFHSEALHEICSDLEKAEQAYGSVAAAALVAFISDAFSFETAEELIDFLGDDIKIMPDDSLSVAISSDYRADLVVVGTRHSKGADDRIKWASVARLKLLAILRVP